MSGAVAALLFWSSDVGLALTAWQRDEQASSSCMLRSTCGRLAMN
jgi:hypothetical protein